MSDKEMIPAPIADGLYFWHGGKLQPATAHAKQQAIEHLLHLAASCDEDIALRAAGLILQHARPDPPAQLVDKDSILPTLCEMPGCRRVAVAHGVCNAHLFDTERGS